MIAAKRARCLIGILLAVGMWAGSASGEIIHLRNGNRLVGKILREEGGEVVVKVSFGEMRVAKEDIVKVEAEPTPSPSPTPCPTPADEGAEEAEESAASRTPSPSATGPPSATSSPSPTAAPTVEPTAPPAQKMRVRPFEEWYAAWHPAIEGDVRGYAHNSLRIGADGVVTVKSEVALLRADRKPRVQSKFKVVMRPDLTPLSFSVSERAMGFQREVEGVVTAGYVSANATVAGEEEEKQVAFPKGALVGDLPLTRFLQTASLSVGSEETYRSFDFVELAPVAVRIKVVGRESVEVGGSSRQALVLEMSVEGPGGLAESCKLWVQPRSASYPSGRVLKRQELPDGYIYMLSSEEEARTPVDYWLKTYEDLLKWMSERGTEGEGQETPEGL